MALPTTITGIDTAVACVGPYKSSHGPIITTTTSNGNTTPFGNRVAGSGVNMQAQVWTSDSNATPINSISFRVHRHASPTDNVLVHIYNTSGGTPTGSPIATSNSIAAADLPTSGFSTFTFSTPFVPSASTQYAAVIARDGAQNATNYYDILGDGADVYGGGGPFTNLDGVWSSYSSDRAVIMGGDTYYFFGRDGTTITTLQAFKATDPTSSFSSIATKTGFATAVQHLSGYQVSDVIHLCVIDGATTSVNAKYQTFDMSSDTFVTAETIASAFDPQTNTGTNTYYGSIVVRSGGEVVVLFNGENVTSMGSGYAQTYWSRRTGVATWTAAEQVTAGGTVNFSSAEAVLGTSDAVHFMARAGTAEHQRTLNSSNVLQTASTAATVSGLSNAFTSYDNAGTQRIVGGVSGQEFIYFDSANTPTLNNPAADLAISPIRLFVDTGDTNKVWAIAIRSSDGDLYVTSSTDDGATWANFTQIFTATITAAEANLSMDGIIFTRGSSVVIPYVVNDNGTLKYNEHVVRTVAATPNNGWSEDPFHANDVISKIDFRPMAYQ